MTFPTTVPILEIYAGDTFEQSFVFQTDGVARNLTLEGWGDWEAQIRPTIESETEVAFTVDSSQAAAGRIVLKLDSETTRALTGAVYDLQATDGDVVKTFLRGSITIVQDVTRG